MNILQLYQDFGVAHLTEGHKHCRPGWVNTPCPWCTGNPGYHLGFDLQNQHYYCWRCGWHPIVPTIAKILDIKDKEAYHITQQYDISISLFTKKTELSLAKQEHRMPSGILPLQARHKHYLINRNFNPDQLEQTWGIVGTGPISLLDHIDYKHRIIAPIIWDDRAVSFQARDITGKDPLRYRACPKNRELIHHKHILYGNQNYWWTGFGICVEGITDVWRFGYSAFCTFGIKYTMQQLRVIANSFKKVAVIFDDDPQAVVQAKKLVADLRFRGVEAWRVSIKGDPGGMQPEQANELLRNIGDPYSH